MTAPGPASAFAGALRLLRDGELGLVEQVRGSSNLALVLEATLGEDYGWAVYKPEAGEQPLWDFPPGLHRRERAAFVLSEHLGWHLVPPTVLREDAPFGPGSLQWYIEHGGAHYLQVLENRPELHEQFQRIAVFDLLSNNTDRKSGHVLIDGAGRAWGIDHGLCFSAAPKLRTVIWDFAGEEIPGEVLAAVEPLVGEVPPELAVLLDPVEVEALQRRAARILRLPFLPHPRSHRQYPWPLV